MPEKRKSFSLDGPVENPIPPEVIKKKQKRPKGYWARSSRGSTVWPIRFKEGDIALANKIADSIGCSPSEAVRTSLRAYAVILERVL